MDNTLITDLVPNPTDVRMLYDVRNEYYNLQTLQTMCRLYGNKPLFTLDKDEGDVHVLQALYNLFKLVLVCDDYRLMNLDRKWLSVSSPLSSIYFTTYSSTGFPASQLEEQFSSYISQFLEYETQEKIEFPDYLEDSTNGWMNLQKKVQLYKGNNLKVYSEFEVKQTQEVVYSIFPDKIYKYKNIDEEDSIKLLYSSNAKVVKKIVPVTPLVMNNEFLHIAEMLRYINSTLGLISPDYLFENRALYINCITTYAEDIVEKSYPYQLDVFPFVYSSDTDIAEYEKRKALGLVCEEDRDNDKCCRNGTSIPCSKLDEIWTCESLTVNSRCEALAAAYPGIICCKDGNPIPCKDMKDPDISDCEFLEDYVSSLCCDGDTPVLMANILEDAYNHNKGDIYAHCADRVDLSKLDDPLFGIEYVAKTNVPTSQLLFLLLSNLYSEGHSIRSYLPNIKDVPFNGSINLLTPHVPASLNISDYVSNEKRVKYAIDQVHNTDLKPCIKDYFLSSSVKCADVDDATYDDLVDTLARLVEDEIKNFILIRRKDRILSIKCTLLPYTDKDSAATDDILNALKPHYIKLVDGEVNWLFPFEGQFMYLSRGGRINKSSTSNYEFIPDYYTLMRYNSLVVYMDRYSNLNWLCEESYSDPSAEEPYMTAAVLLILEKTDLDYIVNYLKDKPFRWDKFRYIHIYDKSTGGLYKLQEDDRNYKLLMDCTKRECCYHVLHNGGTINV